MPHIFPSPQSIYEAVLNASKLREDEIYYYNEQTQLFSILENSKVDVPFLSFYFYSGSSSYGSKHHHPIITWYESIDTVFGPGEIKFIYTGKKESYKVESVRIYDYDPNLIAFTYIAVSEIQSQEIPDYQIWEYGIEHFSVKNQIHLIKHAMSDFAYFNNVHNLTSVIQDIPANINPGT